MSAINNDFFSSHYMRSSPLISNKGCVATSSPMASAAGIKILNDGGNAADAAIAAASALSVVEPCSTGLGGDCFCIYYDASKRSIKCLNGSGRSPKDFSWQLLEDRGYSKVNTPPPFSPLYVTVPGAVAGWVDSHEMFGSGRLSLHDILMPAINLAENGFHVTPIVANSWMKEKEKLLTYHQVNYSSSLLINGQPPLTGQLMKNQDVANILRKICVMKKNDFYSGDTADKIVDVIKVNGGVLNKSDLENHSSTVVKPLSVMYRGFKVWELPPNTQGIVVILALNILENFNEFSSIPYMSAQYIHVIAEALRIAFTKSSPYCCDEMSVDEEGKNNLLSKGFASELAGMINPLGSPLKEILPTCSMNSKPTSDTVYLAVTDIHGNACSFINSNYQGFGTGLVPRDCGFTLQNRGYNFNFTHGESNSIGGGKRPYHTIIPALLTDEDDELLATFGVMGGFMQPQGHVQVLLNMIHKKMNPQNALNAPRFYVEPFVSSSEIYLEEGILEEQAQCLKSMGHNVHVVKGYDRSLFGRGQIIAKGNWWSDDKSISNDCVYAGSDFRADGCAMACHF